MMRLRRAGIYQRAEISFRVSTDEKIFSAYQKVGLLSRFYDDMMTGRGILGRAALKVFWGLSKEDYANFLKQAFAGIPKNFSGRLLEVPVGTGVLSFPIYAKMRAAEIFCLDYSDKMLKAAKKNADNMNLQKINFLQGNVESLPFDDNFFDMVLSQNGFHVFPEKNSAYEEIFRVLKDGGIFCGCMYVEGEDERTDFFVKNFCDRFHFFTPPHETLKTLELQLKKLYGQAKISHVKSFAGFVCKK